MKKKPQNKTDSHTEEIKRYLGALHEDHQEKLDVVVELVKGLDGKVADLDGKVNKMDSRLDRVENKLDGVVEQVGRISEDVEIMKGDINVIKGDLKQKVDYREFSSLEKRVGVLELKVRK
ncbi:MAG: hypothetical protein A3G52_04275 [Candidatus Taylorbacteria bacterium RIFCSPLOWO2_12_FULL_43_20]|uniref:t-SNARE coiled-coil homology domain-containing protein n=1 Tax=Candidatus Taylorbacteria bacterium RIFCSPLOWO2_12_FULL_43_20 TaxID=1802332 RepID=A0A1G2NZY0_9BACT|nr:MAG: hypothetical protein A2825_00545 [Candidatus Taylorbacteria bacterium RIFCSPHIGHO2_01_FULL_43_120]OHA23828.1 MAG: hypothetical protein A3B98_00095 [Candidatus Taylorbacteria bacterium RIFCSPHIGHO2_02_FULL_43_55]OHA38671.1 MAG: hypothetical protein A3H58_03515 [Candidatus Taylorbacteria bacterium RIFCSPLOWO2_02_FULL_43_22b]OHA41656.1 MAG: hypothetical protein A3G52_04275 [Candidatus Taylorbacteria bacterium RIFCSPLOWO2_12_FULL_43_20]